MVDHEPMVTPLPDVPHIPGNYPNGLSSSASVKYHNERMNAEKSTNRVVFLD